MKRELKKEYTIDGINFKYVNYEEIDEEELKRLSRKVAYIEKYVQKLRYTLKYGDYNQKNRTDKNKTPAYYISAIKTRLNEVEEELKKYEK